MKAHLGVDSAEKLIHAVAATPANVHEGEMPGDLLHGEEIRVWGDQAYRVKRDITRAFSAGFANRRHRHRGIVDEAERAKNRTRSKVRSKVEHPIGAIKRIFGFVKVRYRGIARNAHRLFVACALANLFTARKRLLRLATASGGAKRAPKPPARRSIPPKPLQTAPSGPCSDVPKETGHNDRYRYDPEGGS